MTRRGSGSKTSVDRSTATRPMRGRIGARMTQKTGTHPYLWVAVAFVLMAAGSGLAMPPSTAAIVGSLPPAKAGVGSAVNDLTREVGGTLGIAVMGSVVSSLYRSDIATTANRLRWITVGPVGQPGTSIVLQPAAADPGVTEDERRTIVEMMAKRTYAIILL